MMASHHDALWAKLDELELQLAAYKLLRAARGEDARSDGEGRAVGAAEAICRGRQYDAYIRRRDARREAASAEQRPAKAQQTRETRVPGGSKPMSPRAHRCTARDTQEAKRTPAVSIPSTPRRDAAGLPRSRTVNGGGTGATGSPARSHHQRRSSLGAPADFGDAATTPRPFLKRGTGTGGAAAPARLRTPRVHDLSSIDVASTPRQQPPQRERAQAHGARHVRSVSELPFDTAALASPHAHAQARARKRWGIPERPAAMFTGESHRDFSKGLKKLLRFVRKGDSKALSPGKPVRKGWSGVAACSLVDVPFKVQPRKPGRAPVPRDTNSWHLRLRPVRHGGARP